MPNTHAVLAVAAASVFVYDSVRITQKNRKLRQAYKLLTKQNELMMVMAQTMDRHNTPMSEFDRIAVNTILSEF